MPLIIKSQGFPDLIKDLGVQLPTRGPFWAFEPTIIPTYQVGSTPLETPLGALPYLPSDFVETQFTNPGISAVLGQTPNLTAGSYVFQVNLSWINASAGGTFFLFKVRDVAGTVLRTTSMIGVAQNMVGGSTGGAEFRFMEQLSEGDFIFVENLFALAAADVRCSTRWVRTGSTNFSFS